MENPWSFMLAWLQSACDHSSRLSVTISRDKEFFPGGINGPHNALETPVRNTCHWIVALLNAWTLTKNEIYYERAIRLRNWLLDPHNPFSHYPTFRMRSAQGQDAVNGVIGAAWILEALHALANILGDSDAKRRGEDLMSHHFQTSSGAWQRYDPITRNFTVDYTYDHQAWFAAALSDWREPGDPEITRFLDALLNGAMRTHPSGLIRHLFCAMTLKGCALQARFYLRSRRRTTGSRHLEEGYHIYSLYPLARLYYNYKSHRLYRSQLFFSILSYCTLSYCLSLRYNKYGYSYNAPGLEFPMIFTAFASELPMSLADLLQLIKDQHDFTADSVTGLNTRNTPDPLTLSARIYELSYALVAPEAYRVFSEPAA
ncbi:MAG: hypothetical protein KatS3mg082_2417 [Nitrospiraceae bacterium]|nr:MAG: hypothetical protein KatS3mg082_2417 [Nitrospiraceae bacterium]